MALTNTTVNVNVQPNVDVPSVDSVFSNMPEGVFSDFLNNMNSAMSHAVSQHIQENTFTSFFIHNPLLFLIIFFIIAVIIALGLKLMHGAWKLPLAIFVDIIDIMAISNTGMMDFIAAGASFILFFIFMHEYEHLKYVFAGAGAVKCLIPIGTVQVFPFNTVLMLGEILLDK